MFCARLLFLPLSSELCCRSWQFLGLFALFFWFCCLCVGQSAFIVRVCFRKLIVLYFRVDSSLADGVYDLVPEQEEQQQAPAQFEHEQDPSQVSEEPKAAEGKHRSMVPYFETLLCTYCYFTCAFTFLGVA